MCVEDARGVGGVGEAEKSMSGMNEIQTRRWKNRTYLIRQCFVQHVNRTLPPPNQLDTFANSNSTLDSPSPLCNALILELKSTCIPLSITHKPRRTTRRHIRMCRKRGLPDYMVELRPRTWWYRLRLKIIVRRRSNKRRKAFLRRAAAKRYTPPSLTAIQARRSLIFIRFRKRHRDGFDKRRRRW